MTVTCSTRFCPVSNRKGKYPKEHYWGNGNNFNMDYWLCINVTFLGVIVIIQVNIFVLIKYTWKY